MQALWNPWLQLTNIRHSSPYLKSSKQMAQSLPLAAASGFSIRYVQRIELIGSVGCCGVGGRGWDRRGPLSLRRGGSWWSGRVGVGNRSWHLLRRSAKTIKIAKIRRTIGVHRSTEFSTSNVTSGDILKGEIGDEATGETGDGETGEGEGEILCMAWCLSLRLSFCEYSEKYIYI